MPAGKGPPLGGAGTAEGVWAGGQLDRLPALQPGHHRRAVVVAPHPDDEVLAVGGLMQRLDSAGTELIVVSVTDGEASHPDSPTISRADLADRRRLELSYALDALGLQRVPVLGLALPDGGVAAHETDLADHLASLLGPDVLCIAPWESDGHPDHDAVGRAASRACAVKGAPFLTYLVWTWQWAVPADRLVPWPRARRLALSPVERTRKRWAIRSFESQIAALSGRPGDEVILAPGMLEHFDRPHEVFLV